METKPQRQLEPRPGLLARGPATRRSSSSPETYREIALRTNPDGTVETIPLTREILLNPSFEIQVPQSPPHYSKLKSLDVRLGHFLDGRLGWQVFSDVILDWPGLRNVSPDLSIVENLPKRKPGTPAPQSLKMAKEGCRARVVFEVVSSGPLERWKDEEKNPPLFARAGVDDCVLVYQPEFRKPDDPPLRVFSDPSRSGYTEQTPDAQGRFLLRSIGVLVSVVDHGDGDEEIVLVDAATGQRLLDTKEEAERADQAEQRADKAEQDMARAKAQMVVTVLEKRSLPVDAGVRKRILGSRDGAELDRFMERAWSVDSASDLFSGQ